MYLYHIYSYLYTILTLPLLTFVKRRLLMWASGRKNKCNTILVVLKESTLLLLLIYLLTIY